MTRTKSVIAHEKAEGPREKQHRFRAFANDVGDALERVVHHSGGSIGGRTSGTDRIAIRFEFDSTEEIESVIAEGIASLGATMEYLKFKEMEYVATSNRRMRVTGSLVIGAMFAAAMYASVEIATLLVGDVLGQAPYAGQFSLAAGALGALGAVALMPSARLESLRTAEECRTDFLFQAAQLDALAGELAQRACAERPGQSTAIRDALADVEREVARCKKTWEPTLEQQGAAAVSDPPKVYLKPTDTRDIQSAVQRLASWARPPELRSN